MKTLLHLFLLLLTHSLIGQQLIEYTYIQTISKATISNSLDIDATYDVDLYRVIYNTDNLAGELHPASGLACFPVNDDVKPALIYQHGTVGGRNDVPSNLQGGYTLGLVYATEGYATILPDYIGLGVSPGVHPYIHAESEAWAARDMYVALTEMDEGLNLQLNEQVFITGYSQGGHASMALHRMVERDNPEGMNITAGAHSSGPYSVSEKMIEFTLGEDPYLFAGYLAWVTLSIQAAFPDLLAGYEISDIFKEELVPLVEQFKNEEINLWDLNTLLLQWLVINEGGFYPRAMIHDSIRNAIFNDPSHPVSQGLAKNDLLDWVPQAPTRLFYCTNDDQVTFQNAVYADSIMQANGALDLMAIDVAPSQDHGGCVDPATRATIEFFNQYAEIPTSINENLLSCDLGSHYLAGVLQLSNTSCLQDIKAITILSSNGTRLYYTEHLEDNRIHVALVPGVYFLIAEDSSGQLVRHKFWAN